MKKFLISVAILFPIICLMDYLWPLTFGLSMLRAMGLGILIGVAKVIWKRTSGCDCH